MKKYPLSPWRLRMLLLRMLLGAAFVLSLLALAGCEKNPPPPPPPPPPQHHAPAPAPAPAPQVHHSPRTDHFPVAFVPRANMCRVWFPYRNPSEQPPVKPCVDIRGNAPANSYVVRGASPNARVFRIAVFGDNTGSPREVRVHDRRTGRFLRLE